MADPLEFTLQEATLQKLCALLFWTHRVASAAADVAIAESLTPNPVGELKDALQRLGILASDWFDEIQGSNSNG
jgi:hypothetical protein